MQIEPATVKSILEYDYMNLEGIYEKTGSQTQTAYWIQSFEGKLTTTNETSLVILIYSSFS
jgi:hypothetical protein